MPDPFEQAPDMPLLVIGADDNGAIHSPPSFPLTLGEEQEVRGSLPIIIPLISQLHQQIASHILEDPFMFVSEIFPPFAGPARAKGGDFAGLMKIQGLRGSIHAESEVGRGRGNGP